MRESSGLMYFFLGARYGIPFLILCFGIAAILAFFGVIILISAYLPK